jgi:hypothetical protein
MERCIMKLTGTKYVNVLPIVLAIAIYLPLLVFSKSNYISAYQLSTPTQVPPETSLDEWTQIMMPVEECLLPCWWTILPGKTSADEVENILTNRFQSLLIQRYVEIGTDLDTFLVDNFIATVDKRDTTVPIVVLLIHANDGIVEDITVASPPGERVGTAFAPAWEYYNIENAPKNLGIPDAIRIAGYPTSTGTSVYYLMFIWRELGLIIDFERLSPQATGATPEPNIPICFHTTSLNQITIKLQSPTSERTLEELGIYGTAASEDISLVTDFTPEEFIQILEENEGCLPPDLPIFWDRIPTPTPIPSPTAE